MSQKPEHDGKRSRRDESPCQNALRMGLRRYAGILTLASIFALIAIGILVGQLVMDYFGLLN